MKRGHNDDQIIDALFEIKESVGRIGGTLKGVENHLANLNGRVVTHTEQINGIKQRQSFEEGKAKTAGGLWGGVTSVAVSIVAFLITGKQ